MFQLVMHEKNSFSRHVTKMGGGGGRLRGGGGVNTLRVTCPRSANTQGGGGTL